eukprot:2651496-Pyramimonas_sp.AAC.1
MRSPPRLGKAPEETARDWSGGSGTRVQEERVRPRSHKIGHTSDSEMARRMKDPDNSETSELNGLAEEEEEDQCKPK